MSHFRNVIAITLSVTSIVLGQSTGTKPASDSAKAPSAATAPGQVKTVDATRKQALQLLDQLLEAAGSFADAEVRIRVQAQIADLLWEHDQPRARGLFIAAFNATADAELPPVDKDIPPSYVGADSHYPLRVDLLRLISQRDSALAVQLIETVVDQPPNVDPKFLGSGYGKYSEQGLLYRQIAGSIAGSDPAGAARIARAFIEKGDIDSGLQVLQSLPAASADLARDIFTQALAAAKRDRQQAVSNMHWLAGIVFPRFGEGVIRFTHGDSNPRSSANPRIPELVEPFLEFAFVEIMETTRSTQASDDGNKPPGGQTPSDLTSARLLLPYFEQYMPDKAAILRPRLEEAVRIAVASPDVGNGITRTGGLLTVQEMVDAAETTVRPEMREMTYYQAAMRAAQTGQLDQAKEIANKITGGGARSSVESIIRSMEAQKRSDAVQAAIRRGDFDTAYGLINEHSDPRRRIGDLGTLALALSTKKENARAVQVIAEAERLIPNMENSFDTVYNQLRLAGIAARLDVDRGFEDLGLAVVSSNKAKLAARWTKVEKGPEAWARTDNGLGRLGFAFDPGFAAFGRIDFNRAVQAARGIEMKEASVLAQLGICRGVLKR